MASPAPPVKILVPASRQIHDWHRFEEFDAAARTGDPCPHLKFADRDGAEDLTGEPGDDHVVARRATLDGPS